MTESLTRAFVDLLLGWTADAEELTERCRLLVLDGVAVASVGAGEPGPTMVLDLARTAGGRGTATVIGHRYAAPALVAARVNGMAIHVQDYEPMWHPPNHAISPLLPALLAIEEERERAGQHPHGAALLRALAKGIEAQGRLRLASGQLEAAALSLHPPGAVGAIATALACSDLLGSSPETTTAAVGIAASSSSGVLANIGTNTKALHTGNAARNGLEAALLAREGFTASLDALGGPRGWGAGLFGERFDPEQLLAPIGRGRALDPGPAWKLFPSEYATHFGLQAALDVRETLGRFEPGDIEHMVLVTPSIPYIDRPAPHGGHDGKFSWQYTAAVALLDGVVDPASFTDERRESPDVVQVLDLLQLKPDPSISGSFAELHVELTVRLRDGRQATSRCDAPVGNWSRPAEPADIRAKARMLLDGAVGEERAEQVFVAIDAPELSAVALLDPVA